MTEIFDKNYKIHAGKPTASVVRSVKKEEAALFLGRRPTDEKMKWALPRAQKKLAWIIEREGDANGVRQLPWYLGKLVEEAIVEEEFSQYTVARCME